MYITSQVLIDETRVGLQYIAPGLIPTNRVAPELIDEEQLGDKDDVVMLPFNQPLPDEGTVEDESETESVDYESAGDENPNSVSPDETQAFTPRRDLIPPGKAVRSQRGRRITRTERYTPTSLLSEAVKIIDPDLKTWEEAMSGPHSEAWMDAAKKEHENLLSMGTWDVEPVDLPLGRKAIGSKWVWKTKYDEFGLEARKKARLVVQGFSQIPGIDFKETFAPVARVASIRFMLAFVAAYDLELKQMDVRGAYLNAQLEEEIYMRQPRGFEIPGREHQVLRLRKSLYGLKQAGHLWNKVLDTHLREKGYAYIEGVDHAIYIKDSGPDIKIISVYVDDITSAAKQSAELDEIVSFMQARFDIQEIGDLHWHLGMRVIRDRPKRTIHLVQDAYTERILAKFGMTRSKPQKTPMAKEEVYYDETRPEHEQYSEQLSKIPYREAIGCLMYLSVCTRPDISTAVSFLSRFVNSPKWHHWLAVKRVLRYLRGTSNYGLKLGFKQPVLYGYSDSNWGEDLDTRCSTGGYVFQIDGCTVTWSSRLQRDVALSATEAEYMAVTEAVRKHYGTSS